LRESGHFSKLKTLKVEKEKLKELEPNYDQAMSTLGDA
jgi:hypothetical protein